MTSTQRARHRAARRPLTPLDDLASAATGSLAAVGRRSAVVAASGGLVMTMALPASAAPAEGPGRLPAVDISALTAAARAALATSPVVSVPEDAAWDFDAPAITVTANPKPVGGSPTVDGAARAPRTRPGRNDPVPQSVAGNAVLEIAARYVGVPYVSGGAPRRLRLLRLHVLRVRPARHLAAADVLGASYAGQVVSRADAQPGDLIWSPGHVGIYAGGNMQIDAPRPGKTIQFRGIWQWNPIFIRVTG